TEGGERFNQFRIEPECGESAGRRFIGHGVVSTVGENFMLAGRAGDGWAIPSLRAGITLSYWLLPQCGIEMGTSTANSKKLSRPGATSRMRVEVSGLRSCGGNRNGLDPAEE